MTGLRYFIKPRGAKKKAVRIKRFTCCINFNTRGKMESFWVRKIEKHKV